MTRWKLHNIFCAFYTLSNVLFCLQKTEVVNAECQYSSTKYAEGSLIPVTETCLRCTCVHGALRCQLRVCPEMPDPPPPGCHILYRRHQCCPILQCHDEPIITNRIEARFEPDIPEVPYNQSMIGHGCIHDGTVYSSGSAMSSSSTCSYCFCIGGRQRCVRPRCLLPAPGCTPRFHPHTCCPTSYKCRHGPTNSLETDDEHKSGSDGVEYDPGTCVVQGRRFAPGAKVTTVGRSPCDQCYCVGGAVRCTKLKCAPTLPGCTPLVPPKACCAASYNCSGIIEVKPFLKYEKPPDVSAEYAKLRKEAQHYNTNYSRNHLSGLNPHYILAESFQQPSHVKNPQKPSTPYYFTSTSQPNLTTVVPTSRHYIATTKHLPLNENLNPESSAKYSRISLTTTRVTNGGGSVKLTGETSSQSSVLLSPVYRHAMLNNKTENYIDGDLGDEGRNNRRIDEIDTTTTTEFTTESLYTTDSTTQYTQTDVTDSTTETTTVEITTQFDSTAYDVTTDTIANLTTSQSENSKKIIANIEKIVGNNSECIEKSNLNTNTEPMDEITTTTIDTTVITTTEKNFEVTSQSDSNNKSATVVPLKKISSDVETINKKDEDYEYDYNLQPNLEIIPFVAADAVVNQDDTVGNKGVPPSAPPLQESLRETDDPLYPYTLNLFSPPQETEGGFVPRDPPILDSYYENGYHNQNGDLPTVVPSITNPPGKLNDDNCMVFGREIRHGELAGLGTGIPGCGACLCLFGAVVCRPPKCPLNQQSCKPPYTSCNAQELLDKSDSPTVVLDRMDVTESQDGGADPFRDVIRTEPAPDLQSLIDDMSYLAHHTRIPGSTQPTTSTTLKRVIQHKQQEDDGKKVQDDDKGGLFDTLYELLGGDGNQMTTITEDTTWSTNTPHTRPPSTESILKGSPGLLKLAGCNIYGRMYRVGKIIAELSGPCLQCRCTDTGVVCRPLGC